MRIKYLDKPLISFTDLSSMVVMKELGISLILTGDDHFNQVGMDGLSQFGGKMLFFVHKMLNL